jgi:serine/threonine protein kinase
VRGDEVLRAVVERMLRHDRVCDGEIIEIEIGAGAQMLAADLASDGKAAAKVRSPDETPALIGQYRVIRKIGEGGMGVVYLAQQHKPQRTVALKVIRGAMASSSALRRFEHEAHILGLLAHPGIAQIFEAGTAEPIMSDGSRGPSGGAPGGAQPFFAMEFVDGSPITTFAADHKLTVQQRLELMMKVCQAVEHAHAKGVIHRDLKPSNILVTSGESQMMNDESQAGFTFVIAIRAAQVIPDSASHGGSSGECFAGHAQ